MRRRRSAQRACVHRGVDGGIGTGRCWPMVPLEFAAAALALTSQETVNVEGELDRYIH
ncbi:hypothetical protein BZL29_1633 [Mycobacterium kansasii]|uniref:Uncharacterized protein n=1 Tax=Mycobacterium kansasii TaxID=1768 RepID=A0A1V3Y037_MYCKA|nr:hypothetical protein BZL29_1633 [Mycobacterium kansasii]